jgi:hypothetical protein
MNLSFTLPHLFLDLLSIIVAKIGWLVFLIQVFLKTSFQLGWLSQHTSIKLQVIIYLLTGSSTRPMNSCEPGLDV